MVEKMNKKTALSLIFSEFSFNSIWPSFSKFSAEQLLNVISSTEKYSLSKSLKVSNRDVQKVLKVIAPNKPKTSIQLCTYLLSTKGLKHCSKCLLVLDYSQFSKEAKNRDGLSPYCVYCTRQKSQIYRDADVERSREHSRNNYYKHKADYIHRMTLRKSKIAIATPNWANLEKIKEIYRDVPKGMHVDHIVPLNGNLVCGLHVENNLQYLSIEENLKKSNKYDPMAE